MKKAIALFICAIFILSTTSFALWGWGGGKKPTEEAKTKTKIVKKVEKKEKKAKKVGKKLMKKEKKGAIPAVPPKK